MKYALTAINSNSSNPQRTNEQEHHPFQTDQRVSISLTLLLGGLSCFLDMARQVVHRSASPNRLIEPEHVADEPPGRHTAHVKILTSVVPCRPILEQHPVDSALVSSYRCADMAGCVSQASVLLPVVLSTFELCVALVEACE